MKGSLKYDRMHATDVNANYSKLQIQCILSTSELKFLYAFFSIDNNFRCSQKNVLQKLQTADVQMWYVKYSAGRFQVAYYSVWIGIKRKKREKMITFYFS